MYTIDEIIIHCSESPHGRGTDAHEIHGWHKERGFDGIGYHAVILEDGTVESGRPDYWTGAHTAGKNRNSLGVCMIGNGYYLPSQYDALEKYIRDKSAKHNIDLKRVYGHYIYSNKLCPKFKVENFMKERFNV